MHQNKLPTIARARPEAQSTADDQQNKASKAKYKKTNRVAAGPVRATRSTEVEGPSADRKEIESLPGKEVFDASGGITYLESTLLTVPGVPYTVDALVSALFQVSMLPGIKGTQENLNTVWVVYI